MVVQKVERQQSSRRLAKTPFGVSKIPGFQFSLKVFKRDDEEAAENGSRVTGNSAVVRGYVSSPDWGDDKRCLKLHAVTTPRAKLNGLVRRFFVWGPEKLLL